MFESLRYGWTPRLVRNSFIVLGGVCIFVCVAIFAPDDGVSLGQPIQGVVISSGPVSASGICGGASEIATVKLASGQMIQASVVPNKPISAGTQVVIRKQVVACNQTSYEVDFHQ